MVLDENSIISDNDIKLDYCRYGNETKPLVIILGGVSANRYAANIIENGEQIDGWWDPFIGQGKAVDLDHFQVLSVDYYSGTESDAVEQRHLRTHLQAKLLKILIDDLNISQIEAVIGCSFGGMVALAFAELYPACFDKLIVLCAADRSSVKSIGLRQIQRKIMRLGIAAKQEYYAVSLARSLAIVGYRGELEMEKRFSGSTTDVATIHDNLNSYLVYNGDKFADKFSASKYMNLSLSIDLHQVEPRNITNKSLFIGCTTDHLVPLEIIRNLADNIAGDSTFIEVDSEYGHDFFLLKDEEISAHIKPFLSQA
ncbi:MAG: homoserine O-acetyltransferase [Enterobacterales bacterium]|jgi:homoserine O-acetyltransferase